MFETMEAPPFRTVWVFSEYGTILLGQNIAVQQICFVPDPKWVCSRAAFGLSQGPDPGQPMMHTAEPNNSPARFGPLFSPESLCFSSGKLKGRPRKFDNPAVASGKKRGYDGHAHAAFLKDLAGKMRTELGLTPSDPIWIHQDGDKIHWTPACRQVLEDEKIRTLMTPESSATYSPDFNPVEELFGCAERRLQLKQARRFSTSREMTLSRFKQVCREEAQTGSLSRMARHYPDVCNQCITNGGGPTRY